MQKSFVRRYTKKLFVTLQVLLLLFFLLGCLLPYLPIDSFWWGGFIGIAMPYLTLLLLFTVLFWLIVKPRFALLSIICLLIGFKQISVQYAWNFNAPFVNKKQDSCLRVITWNVESFNGLSKKSSSKKTIEFEIQNTLKDLNADIVCLQEFNTSPQRDHIVLLKSIFKYSYFISDYGKDKNNYQSGNIIFSKLPIINTKQIEYKVGESLIYADVVKGLDTIRVFTTHLQSYKFNKENYDELDKIKHQEDEALDASKNIVRKMKDAFIKRGSQTKQMVEELSKNKYPSILCGDFNDVPNNYTYWQLKQNRQDAFIKKGFGIGRSYLSLAPTLRIDYILPDYNFDVIQFDIVDEGLSDHVLLVTDLKKKQ